MKARDYFTSEKKKLVTDAIAVAEANTSGEIRLHVEDHCREDVLDHAAYIFEKLEMHKTEQRNGVLFYLALEDHKFAILGDCGINAIVPENFWDGIREQMVTYFKKDQYAEGLAVGIEKAGQQLKAHFPFKKGDINEISDDISFGKSSKP